MSPRLSTLSLAALGCIAASAASAQALRPFPLMTPARIDPALAARLAGSVNKVHLADNASGAYIADVNGRGRPLIARNGMVLVLNGNGFGLQKPKSEAALFEGASTTGVPLKIRNWNDKRIEAEVPYGQTLIAHDATVRLLVQVVTPQNDLERLEIKGIRFIAPDR